MSADAATGATGATGALGASPALGSGRGAPAARALPRLLPPSAHAGGATLAGHLERHGPSPRLTRRDLASLVAELERSGLTGRGGGGFPTGRKLAAVAAAGRRRPAVVVNASESEPASAKDAVLARLAPHLVLDGAAIVASALGARRLVVATHRATTAPFRQAAADRGVLGADGGGAEVVELPPGFVTGEESAVIRYLDHGIPAPTTRPPRPVTRGLEGRPTMVSNAETLAHVALVARYGAAWFRALGTPEEPGSTLVTVRGAVGSPGVYEVELGTPLEAILSSAGGLSEPAGSFLVGGFAGTFVAAAAAPLLCWSRAGLAPAGARPGAGLVVAVPRRVCGLAEAWRLARYLASESAGQCGPCAHGLPAIAGALGELTAGRGGVALEARLWRWLGDVEGRGACAHPDGVAGMVRSALAVAADELRSHRAGSCSAPEPDASVLGLAGLPR